MNKLLLLLFMLLDVVAIVRLCYNSVLGHNDSTVLDCTIKAKFHIRYPAREPACELVR